MHSSLPNNICPSCCRNLVKRDMSLIERRKSIMKVRGVQKVSKSVVGAQHITIKTLHCRTAFAYFHLAPLRPRGRGLARRLHEPGPEQTWCCSSSALSVSSLPRHGWHFGPAQSVASSCFSSRISASGESDRKPTINMWWLDDASNHFKRL